jgi:hypothetical protein
VHNSLRVVRVLATQLESRLEPSLSTGKAATQRVDGARLHAAIVGIFQDAIGPLTVKEVASSLLALGIPLPGQGRPANIISHLKRIPQIERVGYGRYDLVHDTVRRGRAQLKVLRNQ